MGLFPKPKYSSQLENIIQSINQNPLQPHKMKSLKGTPATAGMTATKPFTKLNIFENNNNNIFLPPTMEAELLQKVSSNEKTMHLVLNERNYKEKTATLLSSLFLFWKCVVSIHNNLGNSINVIDYNKR